MDKKDFIGAEDKKRLERILQKINPNKFKPAGVKKGRKVKAKRLKKYKLIPENVEILEKYYVSLVNAGISNIRIGHLMGVTARLLEMLNKDYSKATKDDIEGLLSKIAMMPNLKEPTKADYKKKLKRFDKWVNGGEECSILTKKIKTGLGRKYIFVPKDLITPEDADKLINATSTRRDRALIHFLWESGCRAGELRNLRISNITFTGDGNCTVYLDKKTGPRSVLLIECAHDLEEYLQLRTNANSDDPVFVLHGNVNTNKGMTSCAISKMLKETAIKAGFTKRMYMYLFRHSRATYLASQGFNEAQLCMIFGWTIGSKQPRTYIHLSNVQVQNAIKKLYGLENKEEQPPTLIKCQYCSTNNSSKEDNCVKCHNPLTLLASLKLIQQNNQMRLDQTISNRVYSLAFKLMQQGQLNPEEAQKEAMKQIALEEFEKQKEQAKTSPILANP
jgi:site-specific recombinase XerD